MNIGNILQSIPGTLDEELFTELACGENVKIERIVSRGHTSPASGWYDQEHNEWVMVVRGEARILFDDGRSVSLAAGDYLQLPAHTKHRVAWTQPDAETVWLAVHYK